MYTAHLKLCTIPIPDQIALIAKQNNSKRIYLEREVSHFADTTLVLATVEHVVLQAQLCTKRFLTVRAHMNTVLSGELWTTP